jgi:hypothetical protein
MTRVHYPYQIASPFDDLIVQLSTGIFGLRNDEIKERAEEIDKKSFLIHQLGLLRVTYINLVETGLHSWEDFENQKKLDKTSIPVNEWALDSRKISYEVVLSYYNFISILNQLNRILPKHFQNSDPIPKSSRIRFYRNKVVEHWDAYTKSVGAQGFTFQKNKPSIPAIERIHEYKERQVLLKKVRNAFTKLGASFHWEKEVFNMIGSNQEYSESIFSAIEETGKISLQKGQDKNFDDLVLLLLQLGFPDPIVDIEGYSKELVTHLKKLI